MKIKKRLYWDLILRYLLFLIFAIVATAIFLAGLVYVIIYTFSNNPDIGKHLNIRYNEIEFDGITKKLKLSGPIDDNSWIEILEDNKVIYIEGNKQDNKMEYTQEELAIIANNVDELNNSDKFIHEFIPFTGSDSKNYILIQKRPKKNIGVFKMGFNTPSTVKDTDFEKEINSRIRFLFGIFIFLIIIIILLFSRITSKKIIRPLKELNEGLSKVINGDYSIRLDFKGNYEFEQIRDAFNYMTEKLQTAEKENKEISDSKKKLLLDISHDLRTPATTIQGYAQALYDEVVECEEKKKKYLKYIYQKSKHVTNLIDSLFKYSKLESSIYDLNREVDDIAEFLRNVVIDFYGEIDKNQFNLDIEIPDTKILYNFDKIELQRALANIINNIIKYNPNNTTLFVSLTKNENSIQIILGDDGVGISQNIRSSMFDALVRGDNARKSDGGTGLGLAISKKIIELHGGHISVQSDIGKGSKFFIKLIL